MGFILEGGNPEQRSRLVVIGPELLVSERPSKQAKVGLRLELDGPEAEQRRAVPLGFAAHVVELAGDKLASLAVEPNDVVLEHAVHEDLPDVQRRGIPRKKRAFLEKEHLFAGLCQLVGGTAAARAAADDDYVVFRHHDSLASQESDQRVTSQPCQKPNTSDDDKVAHAAGNV